MRIIPHEASSIKADIKRGKAAHRTSRNRWTIVGVLCGAVAAGCWILATVATMATTVSSQQPLRFDTSLGLTASLQQAKSLPEAADVRLVQVAKFTRLANTKAPDPRIALLTVTDIKASHRRTATIALARREAEHESRRAQALASITLPARTQVASLAKPHIDIDPIQTGSVPTLLTAMVEPETQQVRKPFDLVLNDDAASVLRDLPETGPRPLGRPDDKAMDTAPVREEKATAPVREEPAREEIVTRRPAQKDVAYAKPGPSSFLANLFGGGSGSVAKPLSGSKVAIYDISAGRVHLPDGTQLEAHSGIGPMRDNPNFVHKKMAGSTPPGTFRLSMREALFHGVAALRMTPVDGVHPYGRTGLLTHSYLLGKNGNSHGCVAFKDYQRFLKAFKRGDINHLIVVPRMPASRTQIAALLRKVG